MITQANLAERKALSESVLSSSCVFHLFKASPRTFWPFFPPITNRLFAFLQLFLSYFHNVSALMSGYQQLKAPSRRQSVCPRALEDCRSSERSTFTWSADWFGVQNPRQVYYTRFITAEHHRCFQFCGWFMTLWWNLYEVLKTNDTFLSFPDTIMKKKHSV